MMWWDGHPGWGGWLVMSLMMLAFWAIVVFGVVVALQSVRRDRDRDRGSDREPRADDAQRLLDERFARGEIDADEYRERRELLQSGR